MFIYEAKEKLNSEGGGGGGGDCPEVLSYIDDHILIWELAASLIFKEIAEFKRKCSCEYTAEI